MHTEWTDLVKDGGISAPAWAFFTTIVLGILGLFREAWKTRKKVESAADSAEVAASNTTNVSNGFVKRQDDNFTTLFEMMSHLDKRFGKLEEKVENHIEGERKSS
jgi:hypothetical protein